MQGAPKAKAVIATDAVIPRPIEGGAGVPPLPTMSAGEAAEALAARKVRYEQVGSAGLDVFHTDGEVWVRSEKLGGAWLRMAGMLEPPCVDPDTWPGAIDVTNRSITSILRVYAGSPFAWQSWRVEFELDAGVRQLAPPVLPAVLRHAVPTFYSLGVE